MEASFISTQHTTSRAKTIALVSLAVVGTFAACFLLFNQAAFSTSLDDRTAAYDLYTHWKSQNNLTYGGAEDKLRFANFYKNYKIIQNHSKKNSSVTLGFTPLAAMSREEFAATHLGFRPKGSALHHHHEASLLDESKTANAIDWTTKGAVTAVKDQGQCGSCWAFSTTGSIEGAHAIKSGKLVSFSEQDLVDCSGKYGNQGCNGGLMDDAFTYVEANGIALESDYPYAGADGKCKKVPRTKPISGHKDVTVGSSAQLKAAIALGPVSVAIEADTSVFQLYTGGVITSDDCGTQLDHGVLAVGFDVSTASGVSGAQEYYKVKNSWGPSWGVKGYVNIGIKDGDGVCGIQKAASYPVAAA